MFTNSGTIDAGITVEYEDNDLTTEAACNDAMVIAYLYKRTSAGWLLIDSNLSGGAWALGPNFSFCSRPKIFFDGPTDLVYHQDYRIAASARRVSSSATRVVHIHTDEAENL
jgi:hypothetical protein